MDTDDRVCRGIVADAPESHYVTRITPQILPVCRGAELKFHEKSLVSNDLQKCETRDFCRGLEIGATPGPETPPACGFGLLRESLVGQM